MRTTVLVLVGLALAMPAHAGAVTTVSARGECATIPGYPGEDERFCVHVVTMRGDDGPSDLRADSVVVRDEYGVVAGENCQEVPDSGRLEVRCRAPGVMNVYGGDGGDVYEGHAGGGDDRWIVEGDFRSGSVADVLPGFGVLDGGEGDDELIGGATLRGGPGDDTLRATFENTPLDGGPGADVLDGGSDRDGLADYRSRSAPVTASLGTDTPAGEAGEGDRLVDVGGVLGGAGDDELTGDEDDDLLQGGPGDDELRGNGGDDDLWDGDGRDLLDGGPGDDRVTTGRHLHRSDLRSSLELDDDLPVGDGESRSILLGGPGDDLVRSGLGSDRLDGGPGRDETLASGGRDTVWLREGDVDTVDCGRDASVRIDSHDLAQGCRRLERTGTPRPRIDEVGTTANYNPGAINGGEFGRLTIRCSDDQDDGCGSLVRVYALGREVGRARVSAPAGRDTRVVLRLRPSFRREVDKRYEVNAVYRVDTRDARGRPIALRARQTFCDYANSFC